MDEIGVETKKGILFGIFIFAIAFSVYFFTGVSWHWAIFRDATHNLIQGKSPYLIPGFFNPPWSLLPLIPFAFLPFKLGGALIAGITYLTLFAVARRMGAGMIAIWALLLNPYNIVTIWNVNLNWLVVLGFILPPQIGIFFLLTKPQIGAPIALYMLVEAYRYKGIRGMIDILAPIIIIFLFSIIVYGPWPVNFVEPVIMQYNVSIWPYSLLIGVPLMINAIRKRQKNLSILACDFFSPYVGRNSMAIPLFGFLPAQIEVVAATIIMWGIWIEKYL